MDLDKPKELIERINKGELCTTEVKNVYEDMLRFYRDKNHPIKYKNLYKKYLDFQYYNKVEFNRVEKRWKKDTQKFG